MTDGVAATGAFPGRGSDDMNENHDFSPDAPSYRELKRRLRPLPGSLLAVARPSHCRRSTMVVQSQLVVAVLGGLLGMAQVPMPGRVDATAALTMRAEFRSHTSLRVSSSEVHFDVAGTLDTSRTSIDFSAAARTHRGGEVVLTVEPVGTVQSPESGPSATLIVGYEGEGGRSGTLSEGGPHVVGRWMESGLREGRILFTLQGATVPGVYSLSLKFVLSTPSDRAFPHTGRVDSSGVTSARQRTTGGPRAGFPTPATSGL